MRNPEHYHEMSQEALEWLYEGLEEQFTPEQLSVMGIHKEIMRRRGQSDTDN